MESFAYPLFTETVQKYQLLRLETAMVIFLPLFDSFQDITSIKTISHVKKQKFEFNINQYKSVSAIPVPPGFERTIIETGSFGYWLRKLPLKKDKTVYTFNGIPKGNQTAQFAVIDISVGNKDLQ